MIKIFLKEATGLALVLTFVCCSTVQPAYDNTVNAQPEAMQQPGGPVSIQTFYDELEPYGQWIDDQQMGYVWVPNAGPDFRPYATNGHWVVTQYGNTWVSDYDWGWAAFHYGRWRHDNYYGWEWVPGTEWGPAWVNWRSGGDYYGWAPLEPGVSIDASFGQQYYAPNDYWVFVPRRYVCAPNVYQYYVPPTRNVTIIQNTTIINNTYHNNNSKYIAGPRPDEIQRFSGNRINVYNINNSNRPGGTVIQNNTVNIYRPQIVTNGNGNNRPAPNRVVNRGNFNPGNNRNPAYNNNPRQPANQGNSTFQGNNPGNNNSGFGGRRNYGNNNPSNGIQTPQQPTTNPSLNNPGNVQTGASGNINGNNPPANVGRPNRNNQFNQPATNTNSQPNGYGWPSKSPDINRNRNSNQVPINQQQQGQPRQQQQIQQNQQNQQQMQQRQQQQQRQTQQNQQNQQQMQQRQQQIQQQRQQQIQQQRQQQQQQQRNQQQRPVREDVQQERHPQR